MWFTLLRQPWRLTCFLIVGLLLLFISLVVINRSYGIMPRFFLNDPNAIVGSPFYFGYLSTVGGVLWFCGAAISLFVSLAVVRSAPNERLRSLVFGGLLALALGVDDLFMIHDGLMRNFGLSELYLFPFYVALGGLLGISLLKARVFNDILLLLIGGIGLAASMILDVVADQFTVFSVVVEDMLKLAGIIFWTAYLTRRSWGEINSTAPSPTHSGS